MFKKNIYIINEKLKVRSTIETFSENKLFKKRLFISVSKKKITKKYGKL